jgi:hypothetical protein
MPLASSDMRPVRRPWQLLGYSACVLLSTLLALIAGIYLLDVLVHAGYDSQENRAPAARIVVAAVALVVALAAETVAIRRLRGTEGKAGLGAWLALTGATVLLLFLLGLVILATSRL